MFGPNDTSTTVKVILAVSPLLSLFRGTKSFAFWRVHTTSEDSMLIDTGNPRLRPLNLYYISIICDHTRDVQTRTKLEMTHSFVLSLQISTEDHDRCSPDVVACKNKISLAAKGLTGSP